MRNTLVWTGSWSVLLFIPMHTTITRSTARTPNKRKKLQFKPRLRKFIMMQAADQATGWCSSFWKTRDWNAARKPFENIWTLSWDWNLLLVSQSTDIATVRRPSELLKICWIGISKQKREIHAGVLISHISFCRITANAITVQSLICMTDGLLQAFAAGRSMPNLQ